MRGHRHTIIDAAAWRLACAQLAEGAWTLVGLWGEPVCVHMAVRRNGDDPAMQILTLPCPDGRYPSVGGVHLPAIRLERAVRDLFGLEPDGLPDGRPWLDHGVWDVRTPLATHAKAPRPRRAPTRSCRSRARICTSSRSGRFTPESSSRGISASTADGETVVRLEQRFGYAHKGVEGLLQGCEIMRGAQIAGRISGDSTVAYAYAYARAVEAALDLEPPPRAVWLRALMAELERLANHLGDVGAICNDAAFTIMLAHCGILREQVLRTCADCFGHRLIMDRIVPGGVQGAWPPQAAATIRTAIGAIRTGFRPLAALYDKNRLDPGPHRRRGHRAAGPGAAFSAAAASSAARPGGRSMRAAAPATRPIPTYSSKYPCCQPATSMPAFGSASRRSNRASPWSSRSWTACPKARCKFLCRRASRAKAVALVEGFRGDILAWVRIGPGGIIERCHLRDPSWFQWPLLEIAIEGNIAADFPLCNKSFNCSYSGHDL